MNDKLKGYTSEKIDPNAREHAEIEAAEKETLEPELKPDPEVAVPTGDEEMPVETPVHQKGMNSLYDKSRKNRDLVAREDADGAPDVELIQRLHAEAAGGEVPEQGIDTNRGDRFDEEERDEEALEEPEVEPETIPEEEIASTTADDAPDSLSGIDPDARVSVKILGRFYDVPQQDIDDAGGLEIYSKNRAATMRLQRAATLEQRALQRTEDAQEPPQQEVADPSTDGQGEADIESLRKDLLDTVLSGEEEDIDKWLEDKLQSRAETPVTEPEPSPAAEPSPVSTEATDELARQYEEEITETNRMMNEEFPDLMAGALPGATVTQQQRLQDAQQYYHVLQGLPENEGRSQKDMAREAAHRAQRIVYADEERVRQAPVPDIEKERQTRIERKRKLPKPSRADTARPASRTTTKKVPTRKEHLLRLRRAAGQELGD